MKRVRTLFRNVSALVLCLWAGGVLVSCGSLQQYSYDELKPAKVSFPTEIRTVAVVNNAVPATAVQWGRVTAGTLQGDARLTTESLAEVLADTKYFQQVVICDSAFRADADPSVRLLEPVAVDRLAADLQVDMLLSVDQVEVANERKSYLFPGMPVPVEALQTKVTPVLHVYLPGRDTPLYRVVQTDSLDWELNPALSDPEIIEEAAHASALLLSRVLVPYWEPATRLYFDGGGVEMRDGAVYAREGDWARAKELWTAAYQGTRSKGKQAKAAFNIALACEMTGAVEEADEWLGKAIRLAEKGSVLAQACAVYAAQLQARRVDLPLLNAQMSRFGDNF